jgi:hypothetical protein
MMNIARLTEFDAHDRHATVLYLAWQAREYLGDAERKEEAGFTARTCWCEEASIALEAARSLLGRDTDKTALPTYAALDLLTRACWAAKAAVANGYIARSYHAATSGAVTPSDWERQRVSKAISIFKRAAETARQETHRALVELCELFPETMPTEEE